MTSFKQSLIIAIVIFGLASTGFARRSKKQEAVETQKIDLPPLSAMELGSESTGCVDQNNCPSWVANGFCTSTFYSTAQKR